MSAAFPVEPARLPGAGTAHRVRARAPVGERLEIVDERGRTIEPLGNRRRVGEPRDIGQAGDESRTGRRSPAHGIDVAASRLVEERLHEIVEAVEVERGVFAPHRRHRPITLRPEQTEQTFRPSYIAGQDHGEIIRVDAIDFARTSIHRWQHERRGESFRRSSAGRTACRAAGTPERALEAGCARPGRTAGRHFQQRSHAAHHCRRFGGDGEAGAFARASRAERRRSVPRGGLPDLETARSGLLGRDCAACIRTCATITCATSKWGCAADRGPLFLFGSERGASGRDSDRARRAASRRAARHGVRARRPARIRFPAHAHRARAGARRLAAVGAAC